MPERTPARSRRRWPACSAAAAAASPTSRRAAAATCRRSPRPSTAVGAELDAVVADATGSETRHRRRPCPHRRRALRRRRPPRRADRDRAARRRRRRRRARILELAREYDAIELVVGHPLSLSGAATPSTDDAVEFAQRLADAGAAVRLVDERLSTVSAQQALRAVGKVERGPASHRRPSRSRYHSATRPRRRAGLGQPSPGALLGTDEGCPPVTQLPPEPADRRPSARPADWHALLAGEATAPERAATRGGRPRRPSGAGADAAPDDPTRGPRGRAAGPARRRAAGPARRPAARPARHPAARPARRRTARPCPSPSSSSRSPSVRPSRAERRAAASDRPYDTRTKPKRRGAWGCLIGLLVVVGLVAGAFFFLQGPINSIIERFTPAADYTGTGTGEVVFMIHDGDTGSDIAENLVDEGVTASYDAFYDLLLEQSPEPEFHPGAYQLAEQMSAQAALDALRRSGQQAREHVRDPRGHGPARRARRHLRGHRHPARGAAGGGSRAARRTTGSPPRRRRSRASCSRRPTRSTRARRARRAADAREPQFEALDAAGVPVDQRWKHGRARLDRPARGRVRTSRTSRRSPACSRTASTRASTSSPTRPSPTAPATRTPCGRPTRSAPTRPTSTTPTRTPACRSGRSATPATSRSTRRIHPADGTWLFFVPVNLDTGETVFSTTVDEHDAAVAQLQEWCARARRTRPTVSDHVGVRCVLAVLGSPIAHSKSPALHRAAYDRLGLDWEYDAIEIDGGGTRASSWTASRTPPGADSRSRCR